VQKREESSEGYLQSLIDFFIMRRSRPRSKSEEKVRRPEDVVGWFSAMKDDK
jgi:hypothetical protein